ncbi:winged helix-turn-helix domain-containing protein [Streptomyces sp. NPDC048710]|uniref:helix-turn-helix domain-containing protein n=1 Tax=unclassified Streptomyces TaxID=2593676 RepID=UPI00371CC1F5
MGVKFAISPLAQMCLLLDVGRTAGGDRRRMEAPITRALVRHDLRLLMAIRREMHRHAPGFLFGGETEQGSVTAELHRVASTPSSVVARQMNNFLSRAHPQGRAISVELRRILGALEAGERAFVQRLAGELDRFWSAVMVARWNEMRAAMEGDIRHRAMGMASTGLRAVLGALHPSFSYEFGALRIHHERTWRVYEPRRIVLHPSPLQSSWSLSNDPWGEGGTHLAYPVGNRSGHGHRADEPVSDPLGEVIGQARLLLLSDLDSPRTTSELAERHHMSPSTVSYHLLRLYRVGLLHRTREGSKVYYQQTAQADRLVARIGHHSTPPGRGMPLTGIHS